MNGRYSEQLSYNSSIGFYHTKKHIFEFQNFELKIVCLQFCCLVSSFLCKLSFGFYLFIYLFIYLFLFCVCVYVCNKVFCPLFLFFLFCFCFW